MFTQIVPLLIIVVFWALIFVAAFTFSRRALNAPREEEHEDAHAEGHAGAEVERDDQVASKSGH